MHRCSSRRCSFIAAVICSLLTISPCAQGLSDRSTLRTNDEVQIAVPPHESVRSAHQAATATTTTTTAKTTAHSVADSTADSAEFVDTVDTVKEEKPLFVDRDAAIDAKRSMRSIAEPESSAHEQLMGLVPDGDDSESRSAFGLLPKVDSDFIQVAGALAIVVTLLLVFRFVMLRASGALAGGRPSGVIEILVRYPVARGQHLSLIKLGRRILLVHQNGTAMNTLSEISGADEVAALLSRIEAGSSGRDAERFRSLMRQYQREHEASNEKLAQQDDRLITRDAEGEIIDLTRSQMGRLRNLFGYSGGKA